MKTLKCLWVFFVAMMAALSSAQFDPMGMARKMQTSPVTLFAMPDVKKEVKLSGDQSKKVDEIEKAYQQKVQDMMKAARDQGGAAMMGMAKGMQDESDKASKAILDILAPDQAKRFGEIQLQVSGPTALYGADLQKSLELTADQVSKIEEIKNGENAKMMAMFQAGGVGRDGKALQKKMKELKEERDASLLKVLTDAQAAKFKELQGAPSAAAKKLSNVGF